MTSLPAKTCTQCGELKTLTDYHKRSASADGRTSDCKVCNSAARAKYRAANREATLLYAQKYHKEHKEARNAVNREYYHNHKEDFAAKARKYNQENHERNSEVARRRRARILGNGVQKYTTLQVLETYGIDCHLCNRPVDMSAPRRVGSPGWETALHIDHVIPISKGGQDSLANVRPSHGKCNITKSARLMGEF